MGHKSPAKILRSSKRITKFLRRKCYTDVHVCLATPSLPVSPASEQTFSPPAEIIHLDFGSLLKQYEEKIQIEREYFKIETQRDLDKFNLELKNELAKIILEFRQPP